MRCLVKYCGGCQATYNRAKFADKLKTEFPTINFVHKYDFKTIPDAMLIICGCPSRCAQYEIHEKIKCLTIYEPDEYGRAVEFLQKLKKTGIKKWE